MQYRVLDSDWSEEELSVDFNFFYTTNSEGRFYSNGSFTGTCRDFCKEMMIGLQEEAAAFRKEEFVFSVI